ncbi:hypothetical protein F4823DRAFT_232738 [Ustulina deusta]|nr:hypothetical protein F4823DRAFT_232738 [Ustulina deusta]
MRGYTYPAVEDGLKSALTLRRRCNVLCGVASMRPTRPTARFRPALRFVDLNSGIWWQPVSWLSMQPLARSCRKGHVERGGSLYPAATLQQRAASTMSTRPPTQRSMDIEVQSEENGSCDTIPLEDFLRVLGGVQAATSAAGEYVREVSEWASSKTEGIKFHQCQDALDGDMREKASVSRRLAKLALAIGFLRQQGRRGVATTATELGLAWNLVRDALDSDVDGELQCKATRSAQGFLAIALCSIVNNGAIDELFRLHVWEPLGHRGDPRFAVHSHQVFAQSWILAGEGTEHSYEGGPVDNDADATHATYSLSWSDGNNSDSSYKLNQISSTIRNTGDLMRCVPKRSVTHTVGDCYSIAAAEFHHVEVPPQKVHATLFFFDASRGYVDDAGVLGPKDVESYTQTREVPGVTPDVLARKVEVVRQLEAHMSLGQQFAERAEWEHALQSFNSALHVSEKQADILGTSYYRSLILGRIGSTNRRFGRYETAKNVLEKAVIESIIPELRLELSGELGVVYRHMDQIKDARDAFQMQYQLAKQIGDPLQMCRAIGNLGMANYQIGLVNQDPTHFEVAIEQLTERVESARHLRTQPLDVGKGAHWDANLRHWEVIGLARLSLCLAAVGNMSEAISKASESLHVAKDISDPTVIAMSRFYHGRALLQSGRADEASEIFNTVDSCTPAIAFCKEPSEEHRGYLRELINAGANLDLVDEHGYCALDYAVFNGDQETQAVIIGSLKALLKPAEIDAKLVGARVRKAYREIFQEQLRPILLRMDVEKVAASLRLRYLELLDADAEKQSLLDELKFIPYSKFIKLGHLPRSEQAPLERLHAGTNGELDKFLIFFSYRWIGGMDQEADGRQVERPITRPDNDENRQYKRMLSAIDQFLLLHPSIHRESIGIWVDYACVDQDDSFRGMNTLPLVLTQCNAIISLWERDYDERAWCCAEALLAQILKQSYGYHLWYESVPIKETDNISPRAGATSKEDLREVSLDRIIVPTSAKLTFDADRPIIRFLERQARLLGS